MVRLTIFKHELVVNRYMKKTLWCNWTRRNVEHNTMTWGQLEETEIKEETQIIIAFVFQVVVIRCKLTLCDSIKCEKRIVELV